MSKIMGSNPVKLEEVWTDWLIQENEYAVSDRRSMEAGAGKYLNFTAIILRKNIFTYVFLFCRCLPVFFFASSMLRPNFFDRAAAKWRLFFRICNTF